jgi:hypothetical protein
MYFLAFCDITPHTNRAQPHGHTGDVGRRVLKASKKRLA